MKILILSNCNNSNPEKLNDCITRTELFIFLMKQYFKEIPSVELSISKCYPNLLNPTVVTKINCYPFVDHIIFVDSCGFHRKKDSFYCQLKKNAKYTVSVLCDDIKFSSYEDIIFTINKCICHKKLISISPPLDPILYVPRKTKNTLCVLLSRPPIMADLYETDIPYILTKLAKKQFDVPLKIGLIDQKSIDWIDLNGNINDTTNFNLYIDFIYELSKANIFFYTYKSLDKYLLYELSMCNTLIVSKDSYIDHHLIEELQVYTYADEFKLSEILNNAQRHNTRSTLIENTSWSNTLGCIVNKLQEMEQITESRDFTPSVDIKTINRNLNIQNKSKPRTSDIVTKTILPTQNSEPVNKKKVIFLQSKILS